METSKKLNRTLCSGWVLLSSLAQPVAASLSFTFNYSPTLEQGINTPNAGFNDPTFGADRQTALNSAANMIAAYFVNYTADLTYDVYSYSANDGFSASAGSDQFVLPGTFEPTVVQEKIITNGYDGNSDLADGVINWNFYSGYNWGLTDTPATDQYDFKFVAMHELLHSFGFLSDIGATGTGLMSIAAGTPDTWSIYDKFLTDASGASLIGINDGIFDATKISALTAGAADAPGVLFNGPNAIAANNGAGIPIYSPSTWADGSSIAHLDSNSAVTNLSIMNPAAHHLGLDVRTLGPIEVGILKDIGYVQITATPLPAAVWLMLAGLFAIFGFKKIKKHGLFNM